MTSPAVAALRAELQAAIAVLDPQIKGLKDLNSLSLSEGARAAVESELAEHQGRRAAIQVGLDACDTLDANNYPDSLATQYSAAIIAELAAKQAEIAAALGEFEAQGVASTAEFTFPTPTAKGT